VEEGRGPYCLGLLESTVQEGGTMSALCRKYGGWGENEPQPRILWSFCCVRLVCWRFDACVALACGRAADEFAQPDKTRVLLEVRPVQIAPPDPFEQYCVLVWVVASDSLRTTALGGG
jgi:hypothetical protein